jgi:hypothetical protein
MRDFQAGQKKLAVQSIYVIRGCVLVLGANEPSSLRWYLSSAINDPQRISSTSLSNIEASLVPVDTAVTRIPLLSIAATVAGPVGGFFASTCLHSTSARAHTSFLPFLVFRDSSIYVTIPRIPKRSTLSWWWS